MTKTPLTAVLALVLLVIAPAGNVSARDRGTGLRAFGQLYLGVAGETSVEVEVAGTSSETEIDLDVSPGVGAGVDFGLHEYIALGPLIRFFSLSGDENDIGATGLTVDADASVLDFDLLPRLRYPFDKKGEIYLGIPVGLSYFMPDAEGADNEMGWNISFVLGGLYAVSEGFGIFAEIGYLIHNVSQTRTVFGVDVDLSLSAGQIGLSIGAAYID